MFRFAGGMILMLLEDNMAVVEEAEHIAALALLDRVFGDISMVFYTAAAGGDCAPLRVTGNCTRLLGLSPEHFSASFWQERVHPDDAGRILQELNGLSGNVLCRQEFRLRDAEDRYRWV